MGTAETVPINHDAWSLSMNLHPTEWLHLAKGLAIGQQGRFPHKGDRTNRANLVVNNYPDRWACYCQSCKRGGVVYKRHITFAEPAPRESTVLSLPPDMTLLTHLPDDIKSAVLAFLVRKNMDAAYFDAPLRYSDARKRLMVETSRGWLGRDVTENSQQKWLSYSGAQYLASDRAHPDAVVVEDPFSFYKVKWAERGVQVYCALGTRCKPGLLLRLIQHKRVLFCLDGDKAGHDGADAGTRRVRGFGISAAECCAPWGMDPKDMRASDIRLHIQGGLSSIR